MFCCSSLDTYLIKQSESFHWERAGSQVKISLTCVFTYTAGYQQSLQVCANAIYFYLPLRATQGPPPSRVLGEMCGGQLAKKPPRISLWIQMVFNSKASRKGFCEGGNFLFFFFFPQIICATSPTLVLPGWQDYSLSSFYEQPRKPARLPEAGAWWVPKEL